MEAVEKVDFEVILTESEEELINMLLNKKVDAAVRGSLSSTKILSFLRKEYIQKIYRASFLELNNRKFLLAPVGVNEVNKLQDKLKII
jgi:predicted methyltransferase MtxX (methanogen marker protein 4)